MANKARLIEVRDKILANKERFYYGKWVTEIGNEENSDRSQSELITTLATDCGTCGCVAGWAFTCIERPLKRLGIGQNAEMWLELDDSDFYFLFVAKAGHGLPQVLLHEATVWDAIQRLNLLIDIETEKETADAAQ